MAMEGLRRFCKSWFFTGCVLLFALAAAGNETRASQNKNNCTYAITIETTCADGAETSNHVAVRFGDTNSTDIVVRRLNAKPFRTLDPLQPDGPLDDVPQKAFRACTVDEVRVVGECVESPVCYLYLKLAGSDDWRPGFAKVQVLEGPHLSSEYFYFRRYLPRRVCTAPIPARRRSLLLELRAKGRAWQRRELSFERKELYTVGHSCL
ncbi:embryo-specific protein ATS3A isoform X2 [Eucalyptus grandis]|uniref:embryo-specific protein ATS3A isoform X2 n=1 Tax=Eucalyptus grandis TaxID=71139 RepID=UPI00192EA7B1|nr:embryo-specific protein ATS3A isoform X2 [Eucalyptus grandis]